MKKDNFYKDSLILTLSNLTTGIFGFIFSIMLSEVLGAEGLGLYGLVMPIYNLFICLICGGMLTAISKVSSIYFNKNDHYNLKQSVEISLKFDLILGILVASIAFLLAPVIATYFIKDARTINSIRIISPALIFVAISSILKGYFYGISNVKVPAFIDIIEKFFRIVILLFLMRMYHFTSIENTVTMAYIALAIGEFISIVLLFYFYKISIRSLPIVPIHKSGRIQLLFNVLVFSLPLCVTGFVSTAIGTVSTLIVPRRLISTGITYQSALSMIGKFYGMALNIAFFPMIIVFSMSMILVPDLSNNLSNKNYFAVEDRICKVVRLSLLLGLATMCICLSIPDSLGKLFYNRTDLGSYIKLVAISIPFEYVSATTYSILNGLDKQKLILRNTFLVSIEELVLLYVLVGIPGINMLGLAITLVVTSITTILLNFYDIRKIFYIKLSSILKLTDLLLAILTFFLLSIIYYLTGNIIFIPRTVCIIIFGFAFYFLADKILEKENT